MKNKIKQTYTDLQAVIKGARDLIEALSLCFVVATTYYTAIHYRLKLSEFMFVIMVFGGSVVALRAAMEFGAYLKRKGQIELKEGK